MRVLENTAEEEYVNHYQKTIWTPAVFSQNSVVTAAFVLL